MAVVRLVLCGHLLILFKNIDAFYWSQFIINSTLDLSTHYSFLISNGGV